MHPWNSFNRLNTQALSSLIPFLSSFFVKKENMYIISYYNLFLDHPLTCDNICANIANIFGIIPKINLIKHTNCC